MSRTSDWAIRMINENRAAIEEDDHHMKSYIFRRHYHEDPLWQQFKTKTRAEGIPMRRKLIQLIAAYVTERQPGDVT